LVSWRHDDRFHTGMRQGIDPNPFVVDRHRDAPDADAAQLLAQTGRSRILQTDIRYSTISEDLDEQPATLSKTVNDHDSLRRRNRAANPAKVGRQLSPHLVVPAWIAVAERCVRKLGKRLLCTS
jgi:hypothetical protein